MSHEPSLLPRKWFAAATAVGLLLAALAAYLLLSPSTRRQHVATPGANTILSLRQRTDDGVVVPWGTTLPGDRLHVTVEGAETQRVQETELLLSRDGAMPVRIEHAGQSAELTKLAPGRYRWGAVVHANNEPPMVIEPPRGDSLAFDFVVAPRKLELPPLQQRTLAGETLELGAAAKVGVTLGAQFDTSLPGAALEIEVKPASAAFDGAGVKPVPIDEGDVGVKFSGPGGPYHWRARLAISANAGTSWRAFGGGGPQGDFVLSDPKPSDSHKDGDGRDSAGDEHNAEGNSNSADGNSGGGGPHQGPSPHDDGKGSDHDRSEHDGNPKETPGDKRGGGAVSESYSSGMGSGYRGPLPSRVRPLPSLWHLALLRIARILGLLTAALAVPLLVIKLVRFARCRALGAV